MSVQVHVHRDAAAAALAAARRFVAVGQHALKQRGRFCAALAGGTTPIRMYEWLAESLRLGEPRTVTGAPPPGNVQPSRPAGRSPGPDDALDWGRVHIFFTDERCVPPDHTDSNYAMVRRCLLGRVAVPDDQIHRLESELTPCELAAERYDTLLRSFFRGSAVRPSLAWTFDLVLLGVGADGHTASLFPGSPALAEQRRWALHTRAPAGNAPRDRITLTLPVINTARHVLFLVSGANKSQVVGPLLAGRGDPAWPAALVHCAGSTEWHVDEAAAGRITGA